MIDRSTNVRSALRARQRGFLLNPYRFGGGSSGFSPLSLPGISGWYDATDSSTVTLSGSIVTAWADKSPAGRNMAGSPTTANRPLIGTKAGRSVLVTPPSNLFSMRFTDFSFPAASGYAFFVTYRSTSSANSLLLTAWNNTYRSIPYIQSPNAYFFAGSGAETTIAFPGDTDLHVVGFVTRPAGRKHYMDGTSSTSASAWALTTWNSLGESVGSAQTIRGGIGEFILGSGLLTDAQVDSVLLYLKTKWGTP